MMGRIKFISILCVAVQLFLAACSSNSFEEESSKEAFEKFIARLESERTLWEEEKGYWIGLDERYDSLHARLMSESDELTKEERQEIIDLEQRYRKLKLEYEAVNADKMKEASHSLFKNIFGADTVTQLNALKTENILPYYQRLVATVKANKDTYTPEQWYIIKGWYNELENKHAAVRDELPVEVNEQITKLKLEYAGIGVPGGKDSIRRQTG